MSKVNFRAFLKTFKNEDSPFGDLARDAFNESSSWKRTTAKSLQAHMESCGACPEAMSVLDDVIESYKQGQ
jgi:uncharacterized protein YozE (UPF0346 family)